MSDAERIAEGWRMQTERWRAQSDGVCKHCGDLIKYFPRPDGYVPEQSKYSDNYGPVTWQEWRHWPIAISYCRDGSPVRAEPVVSV